MGDTDIVLSDAELELVTGYKNAKLQLEWLRAAGYPAKMRPNNTVSLGRAQYERGPMPEIATSGSITRPTVQKIPRGKTAKEPAPAR